MTFEEDDVRRALNARSDAPSAEFRGRLSTALRDGPPAQERMPRLAAVAAVVLAAVAVSALLFLPGAGPAPVTLAGKPSPAVTPSPSPSPDVVLPTDVVLSAPSHDVVWALVYGVQQPYLFRSTDEGVTWSQRPLPAFAGQGVETSFVSDREGWLSALSSPGTQCSEQGVGIWHTTDAGATWQELHVRGIAAAQCKFGLSFIDARHGFIGAYDPNGRAVIYRTADGGSTWMPSARLADPPGFTSQPGGWYLQAGAVRSFGGLLLVSVTQSNPAVRHVYVSRDGGATWRYDVTTPLYDGTLAFITATHWIQLDLPSFSKESTDGGRTWHTSSSDYDQAAPIAPQVVFADELVGYATVRGQIQLTTDGGMHWRYIKTPET